jgi:hypothetical protein
MSKTKAAPVDSALEKQEEEQETPPAEVVQPQEEQDENGKVTIAQLRQFYAELVERGQLPPCGELPPSIR